MFTTFVVRLYLMGHDRHPPNISNFITLTLRELHETHIC